MLIYILHTDRFYKFRLPKKVSGSFLLSDYDTNGIKRNLLNISAKSEQWALISNNNVKILSNNNYVDSMTLVENNFYVLLTSDNERIILYVSQSFDKTFVTNRVVENTILSIGRDSKNDIVFNSNNIKENQAKLQYKNGHWTINNLATDIPIYVNGFNISDTLLNSMDIIFIMGLKIVICSDLIFINNPNNSVYLKEHKFTQNNQELIVPNYNSENNSYLDFYNQSEYFSKSPIFMKRVKTTSMTITEPESKERSDDSFILSIIPSAMMSVTSLMSLFFSINNYSKGTMDKENFYTTIVMCIVMVFISFVWPFIERFIMKVKMFFRERSRISTYKKYLKGKREKLEQIKNEQKSSLEFNNLSLEECQNVILKRMMNLFSYSHDQPQFLEIKLGTGDVPIACEIGYSRPEIIKYKDKLLEMIEELMNEYKYIKDAPFNFSLKSSIAFINNRRIFDRYLESIILKIITFHDYYDLKIVVFTSDNSRLNLIRNLNHCWNNSRDMRFFATNLEDGEKLSSYLVRIYNSRFGKDSTSDGALVPHYLMISDDIGRYKNLKIFDKVLHQKSYSGFSLITFAKKISSVPDGCSHFIDYNDTEATVFESEMVDTEVRKFKPEFINENINYEKCIRTIGNIPVQNASESVGLLPEKFGFLEMFSVGKVEQLNVLNRWKNSQIINSLATPIGIDSNGSILNLDLHEKNHGPHGLIAGMTGSGKSEFIITYILSLAVNYSPYEVQFVLIDYKGGGLAGAFENRKTGIKLPHLVGTITNLDKSSMNRTLVSIKSELQRRQKVFNAAKEKLNTGTIDIYKYQKLVREGSLNQPMSHLFIICDEFAELKQQQPDFMDELVSAARIGRSLGVHLILATQKPSGVVDDQIWSNAKFKVCCKVQTAEDSKEMIRRDDAAYIKESGRFYLQVGYDEIFVKGQSAYSGGPYIPSEMVNIGNKGKNTIDFVDNLGNIIKSAKIENHVEENLEDYGEELGNVLNYIIKTAKEANFKDQQLWLDNIPPKIYLYDLYKKYPPKIDKFVISPLIGEYDDPENQKQGPVSVDLTRNGNLWISGMYGSGKTTLLATIMYSSLIYHTTSEVNIYIVDLIADTLRVFDKFPQVSDFISSSNPDKLNELFYFLNREVQKRKQYYSANGGTFASDVKKGQSIFPNILVVINGLDVMHDAYDELFEGIFSTVIRDSNRFGITFIATSTESMSVTIENNFQQKIALRYLDSSEYQTLFNNSRGIVPSSNAGRGLVELDKVYEFQASLIFDEANYEHNINYVVGELSKTLKKAQSLPIMPRIVGIDDVKNDIVSLNSIPIGIETSNNCTFGYDFTKLISLILFSNLKIAISFENALINIIKVFKNVKIIGLDVLGINTNISNTKIFNSNFKSVTESLYKSITTKKSTDPKSEKIVFFISGYNKIQSHLLKLKKEDGNVKTIDDLIMASVGAENFKFILFNDDSLKTIDNRDWSDYLDPGCGILLGLPIEEQEIIDFNQTYDDVNISKDMAIVGVDGSKFYVKIVRNRS